MTNEILTKKIKNIKIESKEYIQTLGEIKKQIKASQVKAIVSVNKELIKLYWSIGKIVSERQEKYGWGSGAIELLAKDIQKEFPGLSGFSRSNIFRMQAFFSAYKKVAQAARQLKELPFFNIPWFHNVIILQRLKNNKERLWYAKKSIEYGWSRAILETWIKSDLYHREGKAITNFARTLPMPESDMAKQTLKDPYIFDFLTLQEEHLEQDLEQGLINNVQKLLLEMGKGFALIGRQYHLEVGDTDFYVDLLFYHVKLHCYVVVELKSTPFKPEYAGKLNFYLSAVDDLLRNPGDRSTIGLILCKTKDNFIAEYALRDINKPIGIAGYETEIIKKLPKELKSSLPTIEEIEAEFEKKGFGRKIKQKNNK